MNGWHIGSLVCTLITLLLLLTSLCSDYWIVNGVVHAGIWKMCINDVCANWGSSIGSHVHATQAFLILGLLAGLVSTILLCALFFRSEIASRSVTKYSAYFNYIAGVFAMIAMSSFTGAERAPNLYSWSFGLGWACFPLFLIAGGLVHKLHFDTP